MDFLDIKTHTTKEGVEVYPDFRHIHSEDLMIRGGEFYALAKANPGMWTTDRMELIDAVDKALFEKAEELRSLGVTVSSVKTMRDHGTRRIINFAEYCRAMGDEFTPLDQSLTFLSDKPKKKDRVSRRLPYDVKKGDTPAYDELMNLLYYPKEREKLEWAIGSIIAGDSKKIQKCVFIYGAAGTGKGTFLYILETLFKDYCKAFEVRQLMTADPFGTSQFASDPMVLIDQDGDMSRNIESSVFNRAVSHEAVWVNEKGQRRYFLKPSAMMFIASNKIVNVSDSRSGLKRRIILVEPIGKKYDPDIFPPLMRSIGNELGAIAYHCLQVYRSLGIDQYDYDMLSDFQEASSAVHFFMRECWLEVSREDGITGKEAYNLFKRLCEESGIKYPNSKPKFIQELSDYFPPSETIMVGNVLTRGVYRDPYAWKVWPPVIDETVSPSFILEETTSLIDEMLADCQAQYATTKRAPKQKWENVTTTLADIRTTETHFVQQPLNHIVIDFDLRGGDGAKSLDRNLEAAAIWPPTYAEYSDSGSGIHLHYLYEGDATELNRSYAPGIEVKIRSGDSSLRRRVSRCNNVPVAVMPAGELPLKEKKNVLNSQTMQSERAIRRLILENLDKQHHPGTKPSIDFIHKILDDAYNSGMQYDVTDMRQRILAFAANSTNQSEYCVRKMMDMKFSSESEPEIAPEVKDGRLVFYDVEVFPNLLVICWKFEGEDADVVRMINPSPTQVEELFDLNLIGFYNRRYDNHILYARGVMGYDNEQLFKLSQRLTSKGGGGGYFGAAYDISYADIWEFSSKRQSLKLFQIELGLNHKELGLPWDKPVPADRVEQVVEYCANDVITTEQVFNDREQDFLARQMLSALSGLPVMATTFSHTAKIIFGDEKKPQADFVYTDLSEMFPGYVYDFGKSTYKGEVIGEGGYVYAEPGMYTNVAVLDVASMHPTSITLLNLFGPYTPRFTELTEARLAIKRGDFDAAKRMLEGRLAPYLGSEKDATSLAYALKIIINIVYGLTAATFENPFADIRNKDNIVAKRGALFMVDLKNVVQASGYQVIHIKTDSIKIPDADTAVIELVTKFGADYGYTFEYEANYDKFCLVNDAVYIAKGGIPSTWKAVGKEFQRPYVFKTLFSREPIAFDDYCETRNVMDGAALYLDFGEGPQFIGRAGSFVPVKEGTGGGLLLRGKDDVFHSAAGAKGYFWKEAITVKELGLEEDIDLGYFRKLVDDAADNLAKYGDLEWFRS